MNAAGYETCARGNDGRDSVAKTGRGEFSKRPQSSSSLQRIGPSEQLRSRICAKKNELRRASPITTYCDESVSNAQSEDTPTSSAPLLAASPVAVAIAMRVPAYEPGPNPPTMRSGLPNLLRQTCSSWKNKPEC